MISVLLIKEFSFPLIYAILLIIKGLTASSAYGEILKSIEPLFIPGTTELLITAAGIVVLLLCLSYEYLKTKKEQVKPKNLYSCELVYAGVTKALEPIYKHEIHHIVPRPVAPQPIQPSDVIGSSMLQHILQQQQQAQVVVPTVITKEEYLDRVPVNLDLVNADSNPLDNVNVQIAVLTEGCELKDTNNWIMNYTPLQYPGSAVISNGSYKKNYAQINAGGQKHLDSFYVRIPYGINEVGLKWCVSHRYGKIEGIIKIPVTPVVYDRDINVYTHVEDRIVGYVLINDEKLA